MTAAARRSVRTDLLPDDTPPAKLRRLARAVELLAVAGRLDPEEIAITKQLIARDRARLAMELS